MKTAIVTGANGFVGRYLIDILKKNEYKIWAVVRENAVDTHYLLNDENIVLVYCNLDNYSQLSNKLSDKNFDVFYHLAWDGSSGDKRSDYKLQLKNIKASVEALETAVELNCKRFIGAGSVTELMYKDYLTQDFSSPEMPTCYAIAKMTTEYMCRCMSLKYDIEFVWGYIANFYGIGDKTENFIKSVVLSYMNNKVPQLTNAEQLADFTYVSDIALGLFCLGEKGKTGCNYYVGYGKPQPLKNFIVKIHQGIGSHIENGIGKKSFNGLSIDFNNIDVGKLTRHTGFEPKVDFDAGIKKTLEWIKSEYGR